MPKSSDVTKALEAVQQLNRMFAIERFIYLGGAAAALVLLTYAAVLLLNQDGPPDASALGLLFGSGGLFALSGWRAIYFLRRTYGLIEDIIRHTIKLGTGQ